MFKSTPFRLLFQAQRLPYCARLGHETEPAVGRVPLPVVISLSSGGYRLSFHPTHSGAFSLSAASPKSIDRHSNSTSPECARPGIRLGRSNKKTPEQSGEHERLRRSYVAGAGTATLQRVILPVVRGGKRVG